ncbi:MAG: phosphatidylserine decarboxylase [Nitrospirae bacterium]|nr:phosphatidylserine decarboxylase [Nitrospirota bacterium]
MKFAPEGYPFIFAFVLLAIISALFGRHWITVPAILLTLFMLYFFRDPERITPEGDNIFVSPADGKIIQIREVIGDAVPSLLKNPPTSLIPSLVRGDTEGLKSGEGGFIEISIFMSPLNVHVNRAPCDAIVESVVYTPGKFFSAFKPEASLKNENIAMLLDTRFGKVLVRQVAGSIARRVVCRAKAGDSLKRGERFGIIKFSSRLDIYLPKNTEIKVKLGDKVKAGETVIGLIS